MARQWFTFVSRRDHLSQGVNDAWIVTSQSFGRTNTDNSPYLIPNELICGNIASFLRLPIPPFALMRGKGRRNKMFASLRFGSEDAPPNDVQPSACVRCNPRLSTGILLLDVLIANSDRHPGNLKVDDPFQPKEICVFDHDRALFGAERGRARKRLEDLSDRLGITGGSATGEQRHCFLDVINRKDHFREWIERIGQIPDWFIEETCSETIGLGVTKTLADAASDFLKHRKIRVGNLIDNNRSEFPSIRDWGLLT
jgi:hypothetical protein